MFKSVSVTDEEQSQLQALVDGATEGKEYVVQPLEDGSGMKEAIEEILEGVPQQEHPAPHQQQGDKSNKNKQGTEVS